MVQVKSLMHGICEVIRGHRRSRTLTCQQLPFSIPELTNLGGKQHPMDMIFPLFPSNFTINSPLSPFEN